MVVRRPFGGPHGWPFQASPGWAPRQRALANSLLITSTAALCPGTLGFALSRLGFVVLGLSFEAARLPYGTLTGGAG